MVRQLRQRRNNRRRRLVRTSSIVKRVSNLDTGVEFKPPLDQPPWASAPWWPITVVSNATATSTSYSGATIYALIISSLNLSKYLNGTSTIGFNIRILTVRVWGLERQAITLVINDNSTSGCRKLKQLNDRGSPIHYSCLGWRFGKASYQMLNTECNTDTNALFSVGQGTANQNIAVYLQLLIQVQGVPNVSISNVDSLNEELTTRAISSEFAML